LSWPFFKFSILYTQRYAGDVLHLQLLSKANQFIHTYTIKSRIGRNVLGKGNRQTSIILELFCPGQDLAITAILLSQSDQGEAHIVLVLLPNLITQGAACYPKNLAGPTLRGSELLTGLNNCTPQVIRCQILGFKKSRISFRFSLPSSRSATIFLSRWFSFSSAFSSESCDRAMPPNFLRQA
jgi:hypothetical protein